MLRSLALAFLGIGACAASAQEVPEGMIRLPTALYCGEYAPDNEEEMIDIYGEYAFLEGTGEVMTPDPTQSYQGEVRIFLNPVDKSYTVLLDLNKEFTCLVVTGLEIAPVIQGSDI